MRKVVVNTTPLIALSHVGQLDISILYQMVEKGIKTKRWQGAILAASFCEKKWMGYIKRVFFIHK